MGRPKYEITAADKAAAEGWIGRHLAELHPETVEAFRRASSPDDLQNIVERFFSSAQRRRLHNSILQSRHRARQESISITLDGETADQLYQLIEWGKLKKPATPTALLKRLVFERWSDAFWARIRVLERKEGRRFSYDEAKAIDLETLALKAGQKLDK